MGKKKKPFIDKKSAHSFQLVHRSQKDPLQADEESSKHVLLPLDSSSQDPSQIASKDEHKKKEEERQHGIFFDDDYNYLQHLKPRTNLTLEPLPDNVAVIEAKTTADHVEFGKVKLPTEVFASRYEEEEGMLNLAAPVSGPRPDLDPDIVAALDDALDLNDPDNILEDDFMLKANGKHADYESDDNLIGSNDEDGSDADLYPSDEADESDDGMSYFEEEETKSRFTNYSMTSSVIRRNEGLQLIDERFEKLMEEYDEDEIGALDHEELEGTIQPDSKRLNALAEEFIESQQVQDLSDVKESKLVRGHDKNEDSDSSPDELVRVAEEPKEKWDCESILSTYSNLYNHPKLIKDTPRVKPIKLSKAGIPLGVLSQRAESKKNVQASERIDTEETETLVSHNTVRNKDETKEEKKQRKQEVKNDRKVRRMEKKANKMAFKSEKQRQEQSMLNTKQQQGKKL